MLSSSPVIAFVATKDPAKAKAFYQDVLKLKLTAEEPFALVFDANGTMLRVSKVKELTVASYTVLGWKVTDIGAAMKELTGRGVMFEKYKGFPQDEAGVCIFPDGTKVAWFKDPDGNTLSVTQFPK
jgi:catechol 2,3-dioxygenase-like lactoylglutathione lyase family enzyme